MMKEQATQAELRIKEMQLGQEVKVRELEMKAASDTEMADSLRTQIAQLKDAKDSAEQGLLKKQEEYSEMEQKNRSALA